ncbi:MAG TPA: IS1595 family transposase [Rhizomicrobium sp.]|jgi:transposase-like protein|nr:IS1595 family transposase [Rhizomicrobium sp.]
MNILQLFQSFQTPEQALSHLENARWHGRPVCPYCSSEKVSRHASGDRAAMRWQCQKCSRAFAVTVGTIFHGTHIPLKNWFLVLALMLNAKKSASAYQIARDLGMRRPTVWSMMHRVRVAMACDPDQSALMYGIVEADETYIGGKPRKSNKREDGVKAKTGRGTDKTPVLGVIERGGRVAAQVAEAGKVNYKGLLKFIQKHVDRDATMLVTDEFTGYTPIRGRGYRHVTINHSIQYSDGLIHTNSIEGFWALVKRAWYGSHHHYSKKYMHLYIAEACYKFNARKSKDDFSALLGAMVGA